MQNDINYAIRYTMLKLQINFQSVSVSLQSNLLIRRSIDDCR